MAPEIEIQLEQVHGYRCHDTRNNIRYTQSGDIVYHAASVGIVKGKKKDDLQKFFFGHTDDITCIDSYENYIATGQMGENPIVHIWDSKNQNSKAIIRKTLRKGISHLAFSPDGKKLAVCCMD